LDKKEVIEAVTVIETPPMKAVGLVGYIETPRGLRAFKTIWAQNLSDDFKRRLYKNWYRAKRKCFSKYNKKYSNKEKTIDHDIKLIKKYCHVIRLIVHTQPKLINQRGKKRLTFMKFKLMEVIILLLKLIMERIYLKRIFQLTQFIKLEIMLI